MSLTDFQKSSRQEVESLLRSIPNCEGGGFQEVVGRRETYLRTTVKTLQHIIEIYIYEDEAGYMLEGGDWTIYEKPDYSSSDELLMSFLKGLREKLK
ncbi:MAG: hypothetical protein IPK92_04260 [Nitrospira sp.]|nr:hypothetical protein [Nitrospira sp.]